MFRRVLFVASGLLAVALAQDDVCLVSAAQTTGLIQDTRIDEASGLEASRANPGLLYTHNDSGGSARLFAIDEEGFTYAEVLLSGVEALDFEDVTAGNIDGTDYLFFADMGNNVFGLTRENFTIYRFREPELTSEGEVFTVTDYIAYTLTIPGYPEKIIDLEAMAFDPISKDIYLFQKNHDEANASIYKFDPVEAAGNPDVFEPELVGNVPMILITAVDISLDGTRILLKNYDIGLEWKRDPGTTLEDTLATVEPCTLPLEVEPQGEAIAVNVDETGFYTVSEGALQPLYFYFFED